MLYSGIVITPQQSRESMRKILNCLPVARGAGCRILQPFCNATVSWPCERCPADGHHCDRRSDPAGGRRPGRQPLLVFCY